MPIFEYLCKACGKTSERLIRNEREEAGLLCEHCGSPDLEKRISVPAAPVMKGAVSPTRCGKDAPCCGAAEPCDKPSCDH